MFLQVCNLSRLESSPLLTLVVKNRNGSHAAVWVLSLSLWSKHFFFSLFSHEKKQGRGCAVLRSMPHFCIQYVPMNKVGGEGGVGGGREGGVWEWLLFSAIPVIVAPLLMLFRWLCDSFVVYCDGQLWHCVLWPGLWKQRRRQQTCQLQEKYFQCHMGVGGGSAGAVPLLKLLPLLPFCPVSVKTKVKKRETTRILWRWTSQAAIALPLCVCVCQQSCVFAATSVWSAGTRECFLHQSERWHSLSVMLCHSWALVLLSHDTVCWYCCLLHQSERWPSRVSCHVMSLLTAGTPESWHCVLVFLRVCVCVPSFCVLVVLLCVCCATMHGSGRVCVYAVSLGVLVLWCACSITVRACGITVTPECLLHHGACVCWYSWALAASQCMLVLASEWSVLWCGRLCGCVVMCISASPGHTGEMLVKADWNACVIYFLFFPFFFSSSSASFL